MTVEDMVISWEELSNYDVEDRYLPEGMITAFVWVRKPIQSANGVENILVTRAWYDKFRPEGIMRPALTAEDCMRIVFTSEEVRDLVQIQRTLYNNTNNNLAQLLWPTTSNILRSIRRQYHVTREGRREPEPDRAPDYVLEYEEPQDGTGTS
jgi:hypothetical protein